MTAGKPNGLAFRAPRGSGTIEQIGGRWWWQRSRTLTEADGTKSRKRWREGPYPTRKAAEAARRSSPRATDQYARRLTWDLWLEDWLERYVVALVAEERRSYAASLRRSVDLHLRPRIGSWVMVETTDEDIKQLWRDLLSKHDGALARGTVDNIRGALSIATKEAVAKGIIPIDIVKPAKLPRPVLADVEAENARRMNILTPEEVAWAVQAALGGTFGEWSGPTLVALDTGCRRGEALGLKWPDIDFEHKTIRFVRQLLQESSQKLPALGLLKDKQIRQVTVPARTISFLRALHEGAGSPREGLVFADDGGEAMHPDAWTQKWGRSFSPEHPQLNGKTIHDLRHTHASLLLRDGESIVAVSERLGHATASFTLDRYSHAIPSDSVRVAARWERLS